MALIRCGQNNVKPTVDDILLEVPFTGNFTNAIIGDEYIIEIWSANTQPTSNYLQGGTVTEVLQTGTYSAKWKVEATSTTIGTGGNFNIAVAGIAST